MILDIHIYNFIVKKLGGKKWETSQTPKNQKNPAINGPNGPNGPAQENQTNQRINIS